jgi:hypothetical protein
MTAVLTAITLFPSAMTVFTKANRLAVGAFHYTIVQLGGWYAINDKRLPLALNPDSRPRTVPIEGILYQATAINHLNFFSINAAQIGIDSDRWFVHHRPGLLVESLVGFNDFPVDVDSSFHLFFLLFLLFPLNC